MNDYEDMMGLDRYQLQNHVPMSIQSRAAQFALFAALTGFDDEIEETARLTDDRHALTEDELAALNKALVWLLEHEAERPPVTVTYFQPDALKSGGAYVTYTGNMRFLDEAEAKLHFTDGTSVRISQICRIRTGG